MEIKNLKKAADRIKKAVKNKENIILYGDSDLDGVSSVIILEETIKNLGGKVSALYFPDRETDGYGLNKRGLEFLKKFSPALLVTLDCGIGNFQEVKIAKKMKFNVVIIDHHEILDGVPKADIVVDPKQKGDRYKFKEFANVGIAFKLSELVLGELMTENLRNNFLELTALATIADMMPKISENEIFISEGLDSLKNSWRPGIRALLASPAFRDFDQNQKISKIISVLNFRDLKNRFPVSFRIFSSPSVSEAASLINNLLEENKDRKEKIKEIAEKIKEKVLESDLIIFEGSGKWEASLMSAAASILCQQFGKPVFLFKKYQSESLGTVRVPRGIDSVALMKKCKKLLMTFGGHPAASGFRIKNENLEKFKTCLTKELK